MAGVSSIHHIPQNEVCKWHVKSVNVSVFVCVWCDWSLDMRVLITAVVCSRAEQRALQWEKSWGTVTESEVIIRDKKQ